MSTPLGKGSKTGLSLYHCVQTNCSGQMLELQSEKGTYFKCQHHIYGDPSSCPEYYWGEGHYKRFLRSKFPHDTSADTHDTLFSSGTHMTPATASASVRSTGRQLPVANLDGSFRRASGAGDVSHTEMNEAIMKSRQETIEVARAYMNEASLKSKEEAIQYTNEARQEAIRYTNEARQEARQYMNEVKVQAIQEARTFTNEAILRSNEAADAKYGFEAGNPFAKSSELEVLKKNLGEHIRQRYKKVDTAVYQLKTQVARDNQASFHRDAFLSLVGIAVVIAFCYLLSWWFKK